MGLEAIVENDPYAGATSVGELIDVGIRQNGYKSRKEYLLERSSLFSRFTANGWIGTSNIPLDKLLFFAEDLSIPKSEFDRFGWNLENPYETAENIFELIDISIHFNGFGTRKSYFETRGKQQGLHPYTFKNWVKKGMIPLEKLLFLADDLSIPACELERFGYNIDNPYSHAADVVELVDLSIRLNGYSSRIDYLIEKSKKDLFSANTASQWFEKRFIPFEKLMFLVEDLNIPMSELERFEYKIDNIYSNTTSLAELLDSAIFLKGYKYRKDYLQERGFHPATFWQWIKKDRFPLDKLLSIADDLSIPISEFERFGYNLENPYLQATSIAELLDSAIFLKGYKYRKDYLQEKGFHPATFLQWIKKDRFPLDKLLSIADDLSIPISEFERFGYNLENPYLQATSIAGLLDLAIKLNGYNSRKAYLKGKEKEGEFRWFTARNWFHKETFPLEKILFFADDLSIPRSQLERFGYNPNVFAPEQQEFSQHTAVNNDSDTFEDGFEPIPASKQYQKAESLGELVDLAIKLNGYNNRKVYLKGKEKEGEFHWFTARKWFHKGTFPLEKILFFADDLSIPRSQLERFGYNPNVFAPEQQEFSQHTAVNNDSDTFEDGFEPIPASEQYQKAESLGELVDLAIKLNGYPSRTNFCQQNAKKYGVVSRSVISWFTKNNFPSNVILQLAHDLNIPDDCLENFGVSEKCVYSNASDYKELIDKAIALRGYKSRTLYMKEKEAENKLKYSSAIACFNKGRNIPYGMILFFAEDLSIPFKEFERFGINLFNPYASASSVSELIRIGIDLKGYTSEEYYKLKAKEGNFNAATMRNIIPSNDIPLNILNLFARDLEIPSSEFARFGYDLDNPYAKVSNITDLLDLAIQVNGYKSRRDYLRLKSSSEGFTMSAGSRWIREGNIPLSKLIFFADDLSIPYQEFERFGINLSNPYAETETMVQALRTAISLQGETVVGYLRSREGERPFSVYMGQAFFSKNSFSEKGLEFLINDLDLPDNVFGEADWSAYDGIMGYKDYLAEENLNVKAYFETFEGQSPYQYVIQFYKTEPVKNEITFEDFLYSQVPDEHKEEAWYVLSGRYKEDLMMDKLSELAEDTELKNNIEELLGE
ncbi:MAG: hypothetical protein ACLFP2_03005 [Candidatus Woesearchaeota archaeon]